MSLDIQLKKINFLLRSIYKKQARTEQKHRNLRITKNKINEKPFSSINSPDDKSKTYNSYFCCCCF